MHKTTSSTWPARLKEKGLAHPTLLHRTAQYAAKVQNAPLSVRTSVAEKVSHLLLNDARQLVGPSFDDVPDDQVTVMVLASAAVHFHAAELVQAVDQARFQQIPSTGQIACRSEMTDEVQDLPVSKLLAATFLAGGTPDLDLSATNLPSLLKRLDYPSLDTLLFSPYPSSDSDFRTQVKDETDMAWHRHLRRLGMVDFDEIMVVVLPASDSQWQRMRKAFDVAYLGALTKLVKRADTQHLNLLTSRPYLTPFLPQVQAEIDARRLALQDFKVELHLEYDSSLTRAEALAVVTNLATYVEPSVVDVTLDGDHRITDDPKIFAWAELALLAQVALQLGLKLRLHEALITYSPQPNDVPPSLIVTVSGQRQQIKTLKPYQDLAVEWDELHFAQGFDGFWD
jgi:hypothetical protein